MKAAYARETFLRAGFNSWVFLTSTFCLLCNVPMAWRMIIEWKVYPAWAEVFLEHHTASYWLLAGLATTVLLRNSQRVKTFLALCASIGLALILIGRKELFMPGALSSIAGLAVWLPSVAWELLLAKTSGPIPKNSEINNGPSGVALENAVLTAAVAGSLTGFAVFSLLGFLSANTADLTWSWTIGQALHWSLFIHLLAFLAPFCWWSFLRAGAALSTNSEKLEIDFIFFSLGLGLFIALRSLILGHLLPGDWPGVSYAATASIGLTMMWRGQCLSRQRAWGTARGEAVGFVLAPVTDLIPRGATGTVSAALLAGAVAALALIMTRRVSLYDWNRLFETAVLLAAQGALFAVFLPSRLRPSAGQKRALSAPAFILLFLGCLWTSAGISAALEPSWRARGHTLGRNLRLWEEHETSFRSLRKVLGMSGEPNPFHAFLKQNANLDPSTFRRALDLRPVERWGESLPRKPDIYIFMIDSLRQDYVGAYNPKISFTPAIDSFAAENLLVRQAFTAYGGTVLSVASLWAGSHLPHSNAHELPSSWNALERLLDHEGYRRANAAQAAMRPPLSEDTFLCPALDKLSVEATAPRRKDPLFAFTFAADTHMSLVERSALRVPEKPHYRGLRAPYAHQIAKLDGCLGSFFAKLKEAGRYDQSLIILTSDHGELLGDGGLSGHAGSLRPEVIRVPLIIHLPKSHSHWRQLDPEVPVLLTDVTPTLYALLGHKPVIRWEDQGGNFLWDGRDHPTERAGRTRLLSCSYTPVFGLLRGDGRMLYYAHAGESMSYYYDLSADPGARTNLTDSSVEATHNALLRSKLETIRRIFMPAR